MVKNISYVDRIGKEVEEFLSRKDSIDEKNPQKTTSAYSHMCPKRTYADYVFFKENIKNIGIFFDAVLQDPEVLNILAEYDLLTQARIKNLASHEVYHQVDITGDEDEFTVEWGKFMLTDTQGNEQVHQLKWKKRKHVDLSRDIQKLPTEDQKMLWEMRIKDSIWKEETRGIIRKFVIEVRKYLNQDIGPGIIKMTGIWFDQYNGNVYHNGKYIDNLQWKDREFFTALYTLCRNKRVHPEVICRAMGKENVWDGSDYFTYLRKRLKLLPSELKPWISNGRDGYILFDNP